MSSRVISALALLAGAVLLYSAVTNKPPARVVKDALRGRRR